MFHLVDDNLESTDFVILIRSGSGLTDAGRDDPNSIARLEHPPGIWIGEVRKEEVNSSE